MKIIVDTNILIAGMIKDSVIRKILLDNKIEFYTPDFSISEVFKYKDYILSKAEINHLEFVKILHAILDNLNVVDDNAVSLNLGYAKSVMKFIDIKDSPILAAALAIDADFIWSDDRHFKQQNVAKVLNTDEMVRFL